VKIATQAGRLKLNLGRTRHRQQVEDSFCAFPGSIGLKKKSVDGSPVVSAA
jgi:hypothetical protein